MSGYYHLLKRALMLAGKRTVIGAYTTIYATKMKLAVSIV